MSAIEDRPIPPPLSFQGCTPREWQALARATAGLVRPTYTANGTISRAPGDYGQSHVSIAEGAIMTDVETALASCRALINQINAGLSAKEPFAFRLLAKLEQVRGTVMNGGQPVEAGKRAR